MSNFEKLTEFLEKSPNLQARLSNASDREGFLAAALDVAKTAGLSLSKADLEMALGVTATENRPLASMELEAVAGGRMSDGLVCRWYYERFTSGMVSC